MGPTRHRSGWDRLGTGAGGTDSAPERVPSSKLYRGLILSASIVYLARVQPCYIAGAITETKVISLQPTSNFTQNK